MYRSLVLLVISCPCALVISTPVSIVSALAAAARHGVLIKGGIHLERLAAVRTIAFDKTGTLTRGIPIVTALEALDGVPPQHVLAVARAIELRSEHPIAEAIVRYAHRHNPSTVSAVGYQALPGRGGEAVVDGRPALVGNARLFRERALLSPSAAASAERVAARGETPVLVAHGGVPIGVIALADRPREAGRDVVDLLRHQGILHVAMLTGDTQKAAQTIASELGIEEVRAELLPHDKVDAVRALKAEHGVVAMVGDGVNDAPALAAADLGVVMGAAGSDAAIAAADVALMGDELSKIPYAVRLSRSTVRNIRTNVAVSLLLKAVFLVLAVTGEATLWMAIVADTGASLLVIANGLRLLRTT
jgi:Cd2+/Zn2+-exporting ATPase